MGTSRVSFTLNSYSVNAETGQIADNSNKAIGLPQKNQDYLVAEFDDVALLESIWFGNGGKTSIATKMESSVEKAPGIVTVLTGEEIRRMGFRTFSEIG